MMLNVYVLTVKYCDLLKHYEMVLSFGRSGDGASKRFLYASFIFIREEEDDLKLEFTAWLTSLLQANTLVH